MQLKAQPGYVGIAYAAAKIGVMLDENWLLDESLKILLSLEAKTEIQHLMDVISGNAGAITALLDLYEIFNEKRLFDLAVYLGNELISTAVKEAVGISWNFRASGTNSFEHNLTGFSHGTAGIGHSLLELFNKTDKKRISISCRRSFCL